MKPPMPYAGGKQRIADKIVALMPAHVHYVEPFAGGLSVLLAKRPSQIETVNDLNQDLVTFWRVLRDQPEALERVCALTPHARVELRESHGRDVDDLERARRVWVTLSQGRAARIDSKGWRFVRKQSTNIPTYLDGYLARMAPAATRLHNVSLECRPALEMIAEYGQDNTTLLYVDPPYLADRYSAYPHEMLDEQSHTQLLDAACAAQAAVMISGYRSALYDEQLSGWARFDFPAKTLTNGQATESVWINRSQPEALL